MKGEEQREGRPEKEGEGYAGWMTRGTEKGSKGVREYGNNGERGLEENDDLSAYSHEKPLRRREDLHEQFPTSISHSHLGRCNKYPKTSTSLRGA
jgi:hypothetical protein